MRICDVGPRDGLQSEPGTIPTARKVELVRQLMQTGVDEVEVSSFVSPKWIPQLADAAEVFAAIAAEKPAGLLLSALVPNEKGMAAALAVNERARPPAGGRGTRNARHAVRPTTSTRRL